MNRAVYIFHLLSCDVFILKNSTTVSVRLLYSCKKNSI